MLHGSDSGKRPQLALMAVMAIAILLILLALLALSMLPAGSSVPVQVIYIYSPECTLCGHAGPVIQKAADDYHVGLVKHTFNSVEGMSYMQRYGIDSVPAVVVNGDAIRFDDYGGDMGRLNMLLNEKINTAQHSPVMLERNVSRSNNGTLAITTCVANVGPRPVKAQIQGGVCEGASLISGDPSWQGEVMPGERKYVNYVMLVNRSIKALPPQTIVYEDVNGTHMITGPETPLSVTKKLSVVAAFLAGLIAGINPCLLAVMAFISAMTLASEHRGRALAVNVCSFCAGLLATYLLIGFGFLRLMQGAPAFADAMRLTIIFLLIGIAGWSFYDAYTINRPRDKPSILKSLTGGLKPFYRRFSLAANFLLGGAFGLIKMPCVGGMYIAILGAIMDASDVSGGLACLASYNLGVVLPVLALGLFLALGLSPNRVNAFRHKHRMAMKVATGVLLLIMAVALATNVI